MRWGILATGTIAKKFAETVNAMDSREAALAAVGSRRIEAAEEFARTYGIPAWYGSYEAMAADPQVEAVYVSTPNNMHYENCKMCLNVGKHVLCEKPFTTSADQAEELYRLAKEKGCLSWKPSGSVLPVLERMQELIAQGVIGEVRHALRVRIYLQRGQKGPEIQLGPGRGALLDIGIYNLGFLTW